MIDKGVQYPLYSEGLSPSQYAELESAVRVVTIPMDAARTDQLWPVTSAWLFCYQASNRSVYMDIKINDITSENVRIKKGCFLPFSFNKLYVTNTAQAGEYLTLVLGRPNNPYIQPTISAMDAFHVGGVLTSIADVVCTNAGNPNLLIAQNLHRAELILKSSRLNIGPNPLRIGDGGAAAAEGIELDIGDTIILNTTSAIYAHNPNPGNQTVTIAYIE